MKILKQNRTIRNLILFGACWSFHYGPTWAQVNWMPVSYGQLIRQADLVIVARVEKVADQALDQGHTDCALLEVMEVLSGNLPDGQVELIFPSVRGQDGEVSGPAMPDIFYQEGQEGIWFLSKDPLSHRYIADHPSQFKPLPLLARVRMELDRI